MSIQWFPGHMNTARKEAAKTMEAIDVVVEVLDARIPSASCNPLIEELRLARQRPSLKVLNKADLADPTVTQAWLDLYNRQPGVSAVALSCRHAGDAAKIPQLCQPLAPHRHSSAKPLRMLIMGVPNVGKSTLMNMLLKRRIARVGDEPAVTKVQQRHKLNDRMAITDSPGLLWGTIKDPQVGLLLATVNAIGHKVVDDEAVAEFLAVILLARYPARLTARYGFGVAGLTSSGVIDAIGNKRGCLLTRSGGGIDRDKAARILLSDYRDGALGRTSLETPDKQAEEQPSMGNVSECIGLSGLFRSLSQTNQRMATLSQSGPAEIDKPSFDVRTDKLYPHLISDIQATLARHQSPFDRWLKKPDPCASVRRARHNGVETLSNPRFKQ